MCVYVCVCVCACVSVHRGIFKQVSEDNAFMHKACEGGFANKKFSLIPNQVLVFLFSFLISLARLMTK
jgi:hypothetical protein